MGDIRTEVRDWPLVVFVFPAVFTDGDLQDVCADCDALLSRREPFFAIRDLRRVKRVPTATQRREFAAWQESRRELYGRYVVGLANVSESGVLRGAMTAINWITKPPSPEVMVPSFGEALRYGAERYRELRLPMPEVLRAGPRRNQV